MKNGFVKKYLSENNKFIGSILTVCLLIMLVGFSYAFFVYNKTGLYTHTITGGKMSIIYNETTENNITIANAYPLTDDEALTKGLEFEFTITGYNESDKNIYYAIEMDYGEDVSDKERFLDRDIKLSLYENDEEVFGNQIINNLDNQDIHYGMINYGTSSESPVTNNYKLRIWINDYVIISDTISNDLSTWTDFEWDFLEDYNKNVYDLLMDSDSQYLSDFGISIYTTSEFANKYANFKVNVKADLTYDDVGFITYDANGGEFAPEKTSLTTGTITTQKPVYRVETNENISNNLSDLKANQIANSITYEYKGFLGWSSTPDGEVEYISGDYYSGPGKMLYAVYGDTVNKMVEYWPSELESVKSTITNVYFINDLQGNIDSRYNGAEYKWDLSYDDKSNVKGWIESDETASIVNLYIASEGTTYLTSGYGLFSGFTTLAKIEFKNTDTSMVKNMSYMFAIKDDVSLPIENKGDSELGKLISKIDNGIEQVDYAPPEYNILEMDLKGFNTTQVIDMSHMFSNIGGILDLNHFDTSNVTNMSYMFSKLSEIMIKFENFDTYNVTNMAGMFSCTDGLNNLDLNHFNTFNVTDMSYMFYMCTGLQNLKINNFNTSNVEKMNCMFYDCYDLLKLDISNFDTSNVTNMNYMFNSCVELKELDLSNFDVSNVTDMSNMFAWCSNLITVYSNFNWNDDNDTITTSYHMFYYCTSLVGAVAYDSSEVGITMANPDTGYFTYKNAID